MEIIQQKQYKHIKNKEVEYDAPEVIIKRIKELGDERNKLINKLL